MYLRPQNQWIVIVHSSPCNGFSHTFAIVDHALMRKMVHDVDFVVSLRHLAFHDRVA